jgi:hypothetical protein
LTKTDRQTTTRKRSHRQGANPSGTKSDPREREGRQIGQRNGVLTKHQQVPCLQSGRLEDQNRTPVQGRLQGQKDPGPGRAAAGHDVLHRGAEGGAGERGGVAGWVRGGGAEQQSPIQHPSEKGKVKD